MKDKLKVFFQTKKEVIVFVGLLVFTFITVLLIADLSIDDSKDTTAPNVDQDQDDLPGSDNDNDDDDVVEEPKIYYFDLPATGVEVIREVYDYQTPGENEDAIIVSNGVYVNSTGVSFAKTNNANFTVNTIYPGEVVSVDHDELMGITVTVLHEDNVTSIYSALSEASVEVGDILVEESTIGKAGTSIYDIDANVHVHVQVVSMDDEKEVFHSINDIVGQTIDELAAYEK